MSVKVMGAVWESALPQREKFVLLAFADHADHEGKKVFPSVGLVAWKTGYTTRSIRRIVKTLVEKEYLVQEGKTKYGTKLYRIALENLPRLPPYLGDDKLSGAKYGGDILSGVGVTKSQGQDGGGDKLTPVGVTKTTPGGDIAVSPDPSLTVKEPPLNNIGHIFDLYEQEIGALTPLIAEQIKDWIDNYPHQWIEDAIQVAVENNVRKAAYVTGVLKNRNNENHKAGSTIDEELDRRGYVKR